MTLNQKAIDAINEAKELVVVCTELQAPSFPMTATLEQNIAKAKNLVSLWQELKEEQSRKTTHAYKTETSESWLAVQTIDNKVDRAQTELFAVEKLILAELGIEQKWL